MFKLLSSLGLTALIAIVPLASTVAQSHIPSLLEIEAGGDNISGFVYTVPPEAAAIEELAALLEGERGAAAAAFEQSRAEFARYNSGAATIDTPTFARTWSLMGQSGRLTSLAASTYVFEGGAHGNTAYDALLWDEGANDAIDFTRLFTDRYAGLAHLDRAFCAALRAMQAERFADQTIEDPWDDCPLLHALAIAPVAGARGSFSAIKVLVPPYIAGPYSMGSFEIDLPVDAALIAMIRPEYRAAFAAR